ncbi:MAG: class I SAM-dependent methyltransferase [Microbacterium sp.]
MERTELDALLTRVGMDLLDSLDIEATTADVARAVSRLRAAGHSPELVSAVVGQATLRTRAEAKFPGFASRMLFTRAGLEQATRMPVAALHAARMRCAEVSRMADLGCGIGGDALAFAGTGLNVLAVDADPVTAAIAAFNLRPFGDAVEVRHARAEDVDVEQMDAVWLDPARRTSGHSETRRVGVHSYSPSLDWALRLARHVPVGMKLSPALDRALIPPDAEAQWVSIDGSTVEMVLWTGSLARDDVRRAALIVRGGEVHELTAPDDTQDEPVRHLGAYLHEPEGAIIRARLVGDVARSLQAGPVAESIAYLTGDAQASSPFVTSFRVREQLSSDPRQLTRSLRDRGIGRLEIKKRGVDVDPAAFRRKLALKGDESATLFLTRIDGRRTAILAERV